MVSPLSSGRRVDDRFRLARIGRGLSQAALAERAGVTRQAITGIESGHWSPSLDVALALAGALGSSVEELFGPAPTFPPHEVQLATGATEGARLLLSGIGGEQVGFPLEGDHVLVPGFRPALAGAPAAGGAAAGSRVAAHPFVLPGPTVVVAGCDPALALLAGPLERHRPPVGLVWWNCGNSAGRALLEAGHAHVAAVHRRRDEATRPPGQYEAVGFAAWREGLAVSPRYAGRVQDLGDALRARAAPCQPRARLRGAPACGRGPRRH